MRVPELRRLGRVRRRHPGAGRSGAQKRRQRGRAAYKPRCQHRAPVTVTGPSGRSIEGHLFCDRPLKGRHGSLCCPVHGRAGVP